MDYYAGIDVSLETVNICIVDQDGAVLREEKVAAEPEALIGAFGRFGKPLKRVGLEAGPLSTWLYKGLRDAGLPAIMVETRHMKSALSAMRQKTDRNDARGIAHMMRMGWFRAVYAKSDDSQELRILLTHRKTLLSKLLAIDNELRGTLKAFGLKVGRTTRLTFERRVLELVAERPRVDAITRPMLRVRTVLLTEIATLHRMVLKEVRHDPVCRRLMTMPGVGALVALTYKTGVDAPERFDRSADVGVHFGLTPRRYASGARDVSGSISKCGDAMVRTALYEAASVMMHHGHRWSSLKAWAVNLAKRAGAKRAKVALARKLAVILHRMWIDGTEFRWSAEPQATSA
jgi:transposase